MSDIAHLNTQVSDLREQFGRMDERFISIGKEVVTVKDDLKSLLLDLRDKQAVDHAEVKVLLENTMVRGVEKDKSQDGKIEKNGEDITIMKRDRVWIYGIFMLVWGLSLLAVKFTLPVLPARAETPEPASPPSVVPTR